MEIGTLKSRRDNEAEGTSLLHLDIPEGGKSMADSVGAGDILIVGGPEDGAEGVEVRDVGFDWVAVSSLKRPSKIGTPISRTSAETMERLKTMTKLPDAHRRDDDDDSLYLSRITGPFACTNSGCYQTFKTQRGRANHLRGCKAGQEASSEDPLRKALRKRADGNFSEGINILTAIAQNDGSTTVASDKGAVEMIVANVRKALDLLRRAREDQTLADIK